MTHAIDNKLRELDHETLVDIISNIYKENAEAKKSITLLMTIRDPKALYKLLNKEITNVSKGTSYLDWRQAQKFLEKLTDIIDKTEKYMIVQDPSLALKLCKRLIEIDAKLFERIDDSNGQLGWFYKELFKVLDTVFARIDEPAEEIAQYILEVYCNDVYGNRAHLVHELNKSLTDSVIQALEAKLSTFKLEPLPVNPAAKVATELIKTLDRSLKRGQILELYKKISDKRQDVERYIALAKLEGMSPAGICCIAQRLNNAFRSEEAIQWLLPILRTDHGAEKRDELLIEAYTLEGDIHHAA
ncbi:MAG: hypothetical protein GY782_01720 [Gammaproteobacteria bacterium]|nr:hypothetical protein [Gammaproteobacteria bacterium]